MHAFDAMGRPQREADGADGAHRTANPICLALDASGLLGSIPSLLASHQPTLTPALPAQ